MRHVDISNEFLINTNILYKECEAGLTTLDRIIVDISSVYVDKLRIYLVPILYAYWERFFRILFIEFIKCIELNQIPLNKINSKIAKYNIKKNISEHMKNVNINQLHELPERFNVSEAKSFFLHFQDLFDKPVRFADPSSFIDTESNVKYEVLKKNCERFDIAFHEIEKLIEENNLKLYSELKDLVDYRNSIAHGDDFKIISAEKWNELKSFILDLMNVLQSKLYEILQNEKYLFKQTY